MPANLEIHKYARMPAEALLQEGTRNLSGLMRQQLGLDAMDARRLLQGFDDMGEQPFFDFATAWTAKGVVNSFTNKQVPDNPLALLINKKGVAKDAAPLDSSVAGQDFRIHVTQNHFGGSSVVPREQASPRGDLVFQQRPKVSGREVSEIKNFHIGARFQSFKVSE